MKKFLSVVLSTCLLASGVQFADLSDIDRIMADKAVSSVDENDYFLSLFGKYFNVYSCSAEYYCGDKRYSYLYGNGYGDRSPVLFSPTMYYWDYYDNSGITKDLEFYGINAFAGNEYFYSIKPGKKEEFLKEYDTYCSQLEPLPIRVDVIIFDEEGNKTVKIVQTLDEAYELAEEMGLEKGQYKIEKRYGGVGDLELSERIPLMMPQFDGTRIVEYLDKNGEVIVSAEINGTDFALNEVEGSAYIRFVSENDLPPGASMKTDHINYDGSKPEGLIQTSSDTLIFVDGGSFEDEEGNSGEEIIVWYTSDDLLFVPLTPEYDMAWDGLWPRARWGEERVIINGEEAAVGKKANPDSIWYHAAIRYIDRGIAPVVGNAAADSTINTGDLNVDGIVDILDLTELSLYFLGEKDLADEQIKASDVNGDGAVNMADLAHLKQYVSGVDVKLGC